MLIKQIQKVGNRGARGKKQCSFGHDSFSPWDIRVRAIEINVRCVP